MTISANGAPKPGAKGKRTRARILEAAEEIFGKRGFHDASIADITKHAGVAQGSFYIYFPSKIAIFDELLLTRSEEMHEALAAAVRGLRHRGEIEGAGFRAFFGWIAEHPWLYRAARGAEFVNPELRERFYRGFADRYATALRRAMVGGDLPHTDPEILTWAVMGMADFTAMRWIVWDGEGSLTQDRIDVFVEIALRALGVRSDVPARPV